MKYSRTLYDVFYQDVSGRIINQQDYEYDQKSDVNIQYLYSIDTQCGC